MSRRFPTVVVACSLFAACARDERPDVPTTGPIVDDSLDGEIERHWRRADVTPAPIADDAEYLRRVTLDLVGRVPTPEEVDAFLADGVDDKRARLVDRLLEDPAWAEHWAGAWSARLVSRGVGKEAAAEDRFREWLAGELEEGTGWDAITRALLTAEGDLRDRPEGIALASHVRRGDEAAAAGNTVRNFIGVQIECAQCHDHPYDEGFTREDFWATAAYFARTRVRRADGGMKRELVLAEKRRGETRIKAEDGVTDVVVAPVFLGRGEPIATDANRREALANAIVDHPNFPRATAGLVWDRMFGRGIVEPWDSLELGGSPPSLLDALADGFVASDYDVRALVRTVALSAAYQRTSVGDEATRSAQEGAFARAAIRPLPAEPLFASLLATTGLEDVKGRAFKKTVRARKEGAAAEYRFVFTDDEAGGVDAFSGNVPQALLLLNGGVTNQGVLAREGSRLARILEEHPTAEDRVRAMIRTAYARDPSEAELAEHVAFVESQGAREQRAAYEDLFFAMLGSVEFITNHSTRTAGTTT